MKTIENKSFDEERALYGSVDVSAKKCRFDGPADGESAFKESKNIIAEDCFFNLRYPFWHDEGVKISGCEMTELCRAALWYTSEVSISDTRMHGIKALRECKGVKIENCDIVSPEFGWFSHSVLVENSTLNGEYLMMRSTDVKFDNVTLNGKYSLQYVENCSFENCNFDTKDALWHAKNVTVKNSIVKGEYLAWYCEGVTFENCIISGTQPLCYCKGLKLINCEMHGCDLSFEKSEVEADLITHVDSIKNPKVGKITLPSVGEIILDDKASDCEIILK